MAIRDEIVWRSGVVYLVVVLIALAILVRIVILQYIERPKWEAMSERYVYKTDTDPANRGDILARDGRLLASSVPYYSIYMDTRSTGMSAGIWSNGLNGLCNGLANLVGERSAADWKSVLTNARKKGDRYFLIKRRVDYLTLKKLRELPIFREGQYRGGLVVQAENKRIYPNQNLALRTIGFQTEGEEGIGVGIEGSFNRELAGKDGMVVKQRLTGGDWIAVPDGNTVDSKDGYDVVTTIDIDLQDVATSALLTQLRRHDADHGCAVLMEVESGDIRAIANLEKKGEGIYSETYNFAIGESTEPGSTFKLPALMVAIEDGVIDTGDVVDTGNGTVKYYNKIVRDTKEGGYGRLTVKEVFEKSSNVGISKLIYENYKDNPKEFVNRLYAMKLNQKLDIQIKGEGDPLIRYPGDKFWSGLSLPMMSHGYEVQMTPIQTLAFYNAVANNGRMMKPRFVTEIHRNGSLVKSFGTEVVINSIASRSTIKKAQKMLEGVVEHGTAMNLKDADYRIAGKTGTAQIANTKYGYRSGRGVTYMASFVGYFPAENPVYSCIVVVSAPSNSVYYGNLVAGPVFKEISDKVYATSFFRDYRKDEDAVIQAPDPGNGFRGDIAEVLRSTGNSYRRNTDEDWVVSRESGDTIRLMPVRSQPGLVPDVRGMTLRDAMYLLENSGLRVRFEGKGRVRRQSPEHGARVYDGSVVLLELTI